MPKYFIINLSLLISILSTNTFAGSYDGLWSGLRDNGDIDIITINQSNDSLLMIWLQTNEKNNENPTDWEADFGTISGNIALMKGFINNEGSCIYHFTTTFASLTEAEMIKTRVSGGDCSSDDFENIGETFLIKKIIY